jgi:uncharacterized membrane protein
MSYILKNRIWILGAMMLLYILIVGSVSIVRQYNFQTQAYDMGVFTQTMWNTIEGRIMENSLEMIPNHLGVHMSPLLFLLVPFYAVVSSPYTLLVLQVLALAFGSIPLYLLARHMLAREDWALLITASYLLYAPLHGVNLFDFHEIAFFIPLMLGAAYFYETNRLGWGALFLILAAATKENAAIAVAFFGLFYLSKSQSLPAIKIRGAVITGSFTLYAILALWVFMPYFGGGFLFDNRYDVFGSSVGEIIKTIITDPALTFSLIFTAQKFLYIFFLFLPLLFFPLFSPRALILLIPGLAQNLLATYGPQVSSIYQYDALVIPGLFIGLLYGLSAVRTKWARYENGIRRAFAFFVVSSFILFSPVSPVTFPIFFFGSDPVWDAYRAIAKSIPDGVSVAAPTNLISHLSHREEVYLLGNEPAPPDIIIVNIADSFGFESGEEFQAYVNHYVESGLYTSTLLDGQYGILTRVVAEHNE